MSENAVFEKVRRCFEDVRKKTDFVPDIALVLGSGLGDFADNIDVEGVIDYKDIDGFPVSTAPGHVGLQSLAHPRGVEVPHWLFQEPVGTWATFHWNGLKS